jgi:enoyl-CoA hydratase/carnithine racemase
MAHDIATHTAPRAVAASKALLWDSFALTADEVGERETAAHHILMAEGDAREGMRAYLDHRPPAWSGRLPSLPEGNGDVRA